MTALVTKELKSILCSPVGYFFSISFLVILGLFLWLFKGQFNILDNGVASLNNFFFIAPVILSVLIPALTMKLLSEERRSGTLLVLISRPITLSLIVGSKFLASLIVIILTLLPTLIYVYTIYNLGNPVGNIDLSSITTSYLSLLLLAIVFTAVGVFSSAVTSNQIVALIIGVVLNLFLYYGFDILSTSFTSGSIQSAIASFGLLHHYDQMHRGVVQIKDILIIVNYSSLFLLLARYSIIKNLRRMLISLIILIGVNIVFLFIPNYRADFTEDKRYTLDKYTESVLRNIAKEEKTLSVQIWLTGDLNIGFVRLQDAVKDLLADFNRYADNRIKVSIMSSDQVYRESPTKERLVEQYQLNPIQLNEVDREGKASQKLIYPYVLMSNGIDTLSVSLLKNIPGYTAEENLSLSTESLEFEFIDAVRLLSQNTPRQIAFIEGHGELPRAYVYDAEEQLSKYFFVNRGEIGRDVGILDQFEAIIIAGPTSKFDEQEKYIIDQYIMLGGKVLWLVDGAYYSYNDLTNEGHSASMKNDVNLDDILFNYGVRINSDLIQDKQCSQILLVSGDNGGTQTSVASPFLFMPLLLPSPDNIITRGIKDVKSGFVSSIDLVNKSDKVSKSVLLTTSKDTHLIPVPETIDFDSKTVINQPNYFDQSYVPTAVSVEGYFSSAFANRMQPASLNLNGYSYEKESKKTRMIIVSSSDIIRNQIEGQGENSVPLPIGFDRVSGRLYGNRDFIVNAVNWLVDDTGFMQLRAKQQRMYLLNRQSVIENRNFYSILNVAFPILFILIVFGGTYLYRKRKYD